MTERFHSTTEAAAFSPAKMQKVNLYESPRLFCDVYCLEPGQTQKPHAHAENEKIYCVLKGACRIRIGEETRPLGPGDVAIAPAGVVHGVENHSTERASLLVVMAPHPTLEQ